MADTKELKRPELPVFKDHIFAQEYADIARGHIKDLNVYCDKLEEGNGVLDGEILQGAEIIGELKARVNELEEKNSEWSEKAKVWLASPDAMKKLDGYRELTAKITELTEANETWYRGMEYYKSELAQLGRDYIDRPPFPPTKAEVRVAELEKELKAYEQCTCANPEREAGYTYCNKCHSHVSDERLKELEEIKQKKCDSKSPNVMCDDCDCWKHTRAMSS